MCFHGGASKRNAHAYFQTSCMCNSRCLDKSCTDIRTDGVTVTLLNKFKLRYPSWIY